MTKCLRAYNGKFAIWEKPLSGDQFAPFDNPTENMDAVYFHSDLQYLSNAMVEENVLVSHTSLAGVTGTGLQGAPDSGSGSSGSSEPIANGQIRVTSFELFTHDLGYVPPFMVMFDGKLVTGSTAVQTASNRIRLVSGYATTTKIFLREIAISSDKELAAIDCLYKVLVFRQPTADPAKGALKLTPAEFYFGQGKIESTHLPLRGAAIDDTVAFYLPITRVVDIRNGAIRTVALDGTLATIGSYNGNLIQIQAVEVTYDGA